MGWQSSPALVGLCSLLMVGHVQAQQPESEPAWQFSAAAQRTDSTWQEFDDTGRRLLTENGQLNGTRMEVSRQWGQWTFHGQWSQQQGSRAYVGETSLGQPVTTDVAVLDRTLGAKASYRFSAGLSAAVRLQHQRTDRAIASVGAAAGYPEQFNWLLASVGVQGRWPLPGASLRGSQLQGSVWWGQGAQATMQLYLPGRDPATLTLGRLTHSEAQLAWVLPLGGAATLRIDTNWQTTDIAQGEASVVTRSGVPVASAKQPRTRISHRPLGVGLEIKF